MQGIDRNKPIIQPEDRFKASFDLRIGSNINVEVFDRLFLKSGVRYVTLSTKESGEELRWPSEIGPEGWMQDPSLPRFVENFYQRRYIEIPLLIRLQFGRKKLSGFIELGFSPHIYLNTKVSSTTNQVSLSETINETESGARSLRYAFVLGIGVNYNATDRIQIFGQPVIRNYQSRNRNGSGLKPGNFGIELGLRYGFSFDDRGEQKNE